MIKIVEHTGVVHARVTEPGALVDVLTKLDLSPIACIPSAEQIRQWLYWGCVYVNGKRQRNDREILLDDMIRLHTRPKQYPTGVDLLKNRIIFDHPEFLVLDKPAGLPTHPTLDNFIQNAKFQLEAELGYPVLVTHRLDIPTDGLLLMAKAKSAQALINKMFAKRRVEKTYSALVEKPVNPGDIIHYMDPESRVPKIVEGTERKNWLRCEMSVRSSHALGAGKGYLLDIALQTGRTHQIRAQLSELGNPIVGDTAYGSKIKLENGLRIGLSCSRLRFRFRSEDFSLKREAGSEL